MAKKTVRLDDGQGNTLYPEAAESGTNYVKLADGTLIQWGIGSKSVSAQSQAEDAITFDSTYISAPKVIISVISSYPNMLSVGTLSASTRGFKAILANNYQATSATINYTWVAFGRWKA